MKVFIKRSIRNLQVIHSDVFNTIVGTRRYMWMLLITETIHIFVMTVKLSVSILTQSRFDVRDRVSNV